MYQRIKLKAEKLSKEFNWPRSKGLRGNSEILRIISNAKGIIPQIYQQGVHLITLWLIISQDKHTQIIPAHFFRVSWNRTLHQLFNLSVTGFHKMLFVFQRPILLKDYIAWTFACFSSVKTKSDDISYGTADNYPLSHLAYMFGCFTKTFSHFTNKFTRSSV